MKKVLPLNEDNVFDNRPLKVLIHSQETDFGFSITNSYAWINLHRFYNLLYEIGYLSEKQFGFPVEFITDPVNDPSKNEYLTYLESGLSFDLIFPSKIWSLNEARIYWQEEWVQKSYYMNLTPYISYCPDVYANMPEFDEIMSIFKRGEDLYALYAGVPDISHLVLMVKNELKDTYQIQYIKNFDMLFALLERINSDKDPVKTVKISVYPQDLLRVATIKAGYYPLTTSPRNLIDDFQVVYKLADENCKPYFIEDTEILDIYMELFEPFFKKSYFTHSWPTTVSKYTNNEVSMWLDDYLFNEIRRCLYLSEFDDDHTMNHYSPIMIDMENTVYRNILSIQPIFVPYTCNQPEKALSFVNWLFTDEEVADLLTFGTDKGVLSGYRFVNDIITYNKDGLTVYLFHNLIANFSNRLFPFNNQAFDRTDEYKNLAKKAEFPPLYKAIVSVQNKDAFDLLKLTDNQRRSMQKRTEYLQSVLDHFLEDPESRVTADRIKNDLREMLDQADLLEEYKKHIDELIDYYKLQRSKIMPIFHCYLYFAIPLLHACNQNQRHIL
jgi:hypothetical protein